jgi:hypothetical protein
MYKYEWLNKHSADKHLGDIFKGLKEISSSKRSVSNNTHIINYHMMRFIEDYDGMTRRYLVTCHYKKRWDGLVDIRVTDTDSRRRVKKLEEKLYKYCRLSVFKIHKETRVLLPPQYRKEFDECSCYICRKPGKFAGECCNDCTAKKMVFHRAKNKTPKELRAKIKSLKDWIQLTEIHLKHRKESTSDLVRRFNNANSAERDTIPNP